MDDLSSDEFLTAAEACALLGVKTATLYAYVSRGVIQSYKQGIRRQSLYRREDVERLLRVRSQDQPEPVEDASPELPHASSWVGDR